MNKADKKYLDEVVVEVMSKANGKIIQNCEFIGVQFDAKAVNAIELIATGLVENAKALGALAQVLKASNVEIGTLIRIEGEPK